MGESPNPTCNKRLPTRRTIGRFQHGACRTNPSPSERTDRFHLGACERNSPRAKRRDRFHHGACNRNSPRGKRRDRFQHGACKRNSPPEERRDRPAHHYYHLLLNRDGHWCTTDDFITSFLHFSPFSTALWDSKNIQASQFPDGVFPPLPLSVLSSSPFHCALQDGFGQT